MGETSLKQRLKKHLRTVKTHAYFYLEKLKFSITEITKIYC